jgi:hypothetical protein
MKPKFYWQPWMTEVYGSARLGKYLFWSEILRMKGSDKCAGRRDMNYGSGPFNWLRKYFNWRECAIIDAHCATDASFLIGYSYPGQKFCRIVPYGFVRRISDGPYAMRLGPRPIDFFVVGTAPIVLAAIDLVCRGTPGYDAAGIDLY